MRSYGIYDVSARVDARARRGSCGARAMGGGARSGPKRLGAFGSRWSSSRPQASSSPSPCTSAHGRRVSGCACRRRRSSSRFFPVSSAVGWILLASQPGSNWVEGRIHSWSSSLGIFGIVHSLGLWRGALAFGFGVMLALSLDGVPEPARRRSIQSPRTSLCSASVGGRAVATARASHGAEDECWMGIIGRRVRSRHLTR